MPLRNQNLLQPVKTGDIVEQRGERWHFVGRNDEIISVGANKVSLTEIENCAREVVGVLEAEAFGVPNPILGSLVKLRVVLENPLVLADLRKFLKSRLPRVSIPADIEIVERLTVSSALKRVRQ